VRFLLLLLCFSFVGCATTKEDKPLDRSPMKLTEIKAPPPKVEGRVVALPAEEATPEQKACVGLLEVPADGYVLSESKLMNAAEVRLYANQTYSDAVANSAICTAFNDSTWKQLKNADEILADIHEEQNSWWYRNKGTVTFGSGFFLGAASAILIVYGVNKALE